MKGDQLLEILNRIERDRPKLNPEGAEFLAGKFLPMSGISEKYQPHWIDSPDQLKGYRIERGYFLFGVAQNLSTTQVPRAGAAWTATEQLARGVLNSDAPRTTEMTIYANDQRVRDTCAQMVASLLECGVFFIYLTQEREALLLRRPVIQFDEQNRLHRDDGPAIAWPGGPYYWFLRGLQVDERIVMDPRSLTVEEINGQRNIEIRRVMMEQYGLDRYLRKSNAREITKDAYGTLWECPVPGDVPLRMVEVLNSTPEPDGHYKTYFLRVPQNVRDPHEAVAWTFGMTKATYNPLAQT